MISLSQVYVLIDCSSTRAGACPDGRVFKALPLTASCLSPLPGFESEPGHVRNLPITWDEAVFFAGYSGFLHQLQLASHD